MITFEDIKKQYKNTEVLHGISFEVPKGSLVSIIGPSGCGKTTLLKMVNKLIKNTSGNIYINGENIKNTETINLRRKIGYVIQQTGLFPHMTVRENIEIIPRLQGVDKDVLMKKTKDLMEMIGLEESLLDRYPTELSGGQQQRVGVARAFVIDPEIILMDEPFSSLDPVTRSSLQEEIVSLQEKVKKTILFVTHDMDEAIKISDYICIMQEGKIAQYDTPENILKNPANDFVKNFIGANRVWSSPQYIKAKDIMIASPVVCYKNNTLIQCLEKMYFEKVDTLIVVDFETKKLLGLVKAKQLQNLSNYRMRVEEIMTASEIRKVNEDINLLEILELVKEEELTNLIVVDENDILKGIITRSSLVLAMGQQYQKEVKEGD